MRAVVERVMESSVSVDGELIGMIGHGLLVLVGVHEEDTEKDAWYVADKVIGLRIFTDETGLFNHSIEEVGGSVLLISQFTLHGDCRKGRRPSFIRAARPEKAEPLYGAVLERLRVRGLEVATGRFGAHMSVHLVNDGPVTLLIDSGKVF